MELIVGFNLSSYSHCTSNTRLTTDTGNCCRACEVKNYVAIVYCYVNCLNAIKTSYRTCRNFLGI